MSARLYWFVVRQGSSTDQHLSSNENLRQGLPLTDRGRNTLLREIRAYMVATVWKVVAGKGDALSAGDEIVILESMKMEVPVTAEYSGTLIELHVQEGDMVQEGDLIGIISEQPA